ncbi:MAG: CRISPR system precrRNA processing endoribonuclease RAMP protein Cas6 [Methanosarcinaceae archaeon]
MTATLTQSDTSWPATLQNQSFTWASFQFILQAKEMLYLPPYKGAALRGGFGNSFRKVCCVMPRQDCKDCSLNQNCAYSYIFETPRLENMPTQFQAANMPHPFVIEPPETDRREYQAGELIKFGLTLVGKSIPFLPYFVFAFDQLGRMGLGKGRGKFALTEVLAVEDLQQPAQIPVYNGQTQILNGNFKEWRLQDLFPPAAQHPAEQIRLKFVTPTRILQRNQLIKALPFALFIRTLLRRISLLGVIHCDGGWDLPYKQIIEQAEQTVRNARSDLTWVDWERYSTRQHQRMHFGGFVGTTEYAGELSPFLPLILLGQYLHVGKNTTFGLGKYRIESV